jgi:hemoglobin
MSRKAAEAVCAAAATLPDLDSPAHIRAFITAFYDRLLADPRIAPVFLEVVEIDIRRHLPLICAYWEKLLLGGDAYRRHTMNIHRAVHARRPLTPADFGVWLGHFRAALEEGFSGPQAARARGIAERIAQNMQAQL